MERGGILRTALRTGNYDHIKDLPPDDPEPDQETLEDWMNDSGCEATDGCWVEHDGTCPHGCESWFLRLGLI